MGVLRLSNAAVVWIVWMLESSTPIELAYLLLSDHHNCILPSSLIFHNNIAPEIPLIWIWLNITCLLYCLKPTVDPTETPGHH